MLNELRAWLNGSREYDAGVIIYHQVGDQNNLKALFAKGKTPFCYQLLQDELKGIFTQLKSEQEDSTAKKTITSSPLVTSKNVSAEPVNNELYQACLKEANHKYKEAMNTRAVLFKMVPSELYSDPNRPDLVEQRKDLALQAVILYNEASALYDKADYVKINGKLPDEPAGDVAEDPDSIHDVLVFYKLDGYRKNYNKLKAKEQTPERIVQLQVYELNIKKLEERWRLLRSAHP